MVFVENFCTILVIDFCTRLTEKKSLYNVRFIKDKRQNIPGVHFSIVVYPKNNITLTLAKDAKAGKDSNFGSTFHIHMFLLYHNAQ